METKKRKADLQLTAENVYEEAPNDMGTEPSKKRLGIAYVCMSIFCS